MRTAGRLETSATPAYVTTSVGQLRFWSTGVTAEGPLVVALVGPTRAAADLAGELSTTGIIAVELPGLGGSTGLLSDSIHPMADAIAEALAFLADARFALVGFELACALLPILADRLKPVVVATVGLPDARAWIDVGPPVPDLKPREDGSHLAALWCFLRDRHLLDPLHPRMPRPASDQLPSTNQLSAAFLDAVKQPSGFSAVWNILGAALPATGSSFIEVPVSSELLGALGALPASGAPAIPPTAPGPGVWHQYLEVGQGRVHLRRSGDRGRPIFVLPSAGGSSAPFIPLLNAFGVDRTAVAIDYFGNGLSDALDRPETTVHLMAEDAFSIADALGWSTFDVWGSHTGACLAIEMIRQCPERIGRGVLEAPVFVSPDFHAELMDRYFPDFTPHDSGLHLLKAWHWRRDMFLYWPWYRRHGHDRRDLGLPDAEELHLWTVGVLESGASWDVTYRAGFSYATASQLAHLGRPALLTSGPDDMLANALIEAAALPPHGMLQVRSTPATVWYPNQNPRSLEETVETYRRFLQ
jgi:pimeloyl-ACP methyl ester carboxylesterase